MVAGETGAPPDPLTASDAAELVERLNQLRAWAGQPSLRTLRRLAGTTQAPNGDVVDALPATTTSAVLTGKRLPRLPRLAFVDAFVTACLEARGRPPAEARRAVDRWRHSWRALSEPANGQVTGPTTTRTADRATSPEAARVDRPDFVVPMELPPDIATFTGRSRELETMDRLLDRYDQAAGPVVVTAVDGTAGVGKTALAVRWAHQAADRFPDGQLFVNLRGHAATEPVAPTEALARLLRALGLPPEHIPATEEERTARYRSMLAGKRILILLDSAHSAEQVRPLLPSQPGCLALVTSRATLAGLAALNDAHLLTLDLLTPDEAITLLARILGDASIMNEPEAAAELARLCGYLPLALRTAAAHLATRAQSLSDMVAQLSEGNRLAALQVPGDPRTAIRVAFDHSYQALHEQTRRLFRHLGLHPGPDFTPHSAAALIDTTTEQTQRLIDQLAAVHLVEPYTRGRYRLHDLLRDYAAEQAAAEESEQDRASALRRLYDWYLHTADNATRLLFPAFPAGVIQLVPTDAAWRPLEFSAYEQAWAWCEAERANVVAAVRQAADLELLNAAMYLSFCLWYFFWAGKHWTDWIATHRIGVAAARHLDDRLSEAWLLIRLGEAYAMAGRFDDALDCCGRAGPVLREFGDRLGEAIYLYTMGVTYAGMGRLDDAIKACRHALEIAREIDPGLEGAAAAALGYTYRRAGLHAESLSPLRQALAAAREYGPRWAEALVLNNLGDAHQGLGQYEQAIDHHRQALAIHHDISDPWGKGKTLSALGNALHHTGRTDPANQCWLQAIAIYDQIDTSQADEIRGRLQTKELTPPPELS